MDFPQTCRNCGLAQTGVGPCRNCGDLVAPESIGDSMVQLGEFPEISRFDLEIDTTLDVGAEAARSLDVAQVSLPVADESAAAVDCGPLSMIPDASRPHAKRKDADFGFSLHQAESQVCVFIVWLTSEIAAHWCLWSEASPELQRSHTNKLNCNDQVEQNAHS